MRAAIRWTRGLAGHPRAPAVALAVILALSLAARLYRIEQPCSSPCRTPAQHTLIFDEAFYVNAARVIAHVRQPPGSTYAAAPHGRDPNAEHPQLAKLIIAAGIEVFGDDGWGWRIGSVLFGMLALLALYALVTGAGGSRWLGVGATGVMALDNLALVHSRIATLDVYALAMMLVAAALYVRRRPWAAGLALGVGECMKEVALFLLVALVLYELVRAPLARRDAPDRFSWRAELRPLGICVVSSLAAFFALLWVLDVLVPAYDPGTGKLYGGSPFTHFGHMVSYAQGLTANPRQRGISSPPLDWLLNRRPIDYARVAVNVMAGRRTLSSRSIFDFKGEMNPFIIFVALPALLAAVVAVWRSRDRVALIGVTWAVGTWLPFAIQSQIGDRISYLYYMLIVMPGVYVITARLFSPRYVPRIATLFWVGLLVFGFVRLYPIRTIFGT